METLISPASPMDTSSDVAPTEFDANDYNSPITEEDFILSGQPPNQEVVGRIVIGEIPQIKGIFEAEDLADTSSLEESISSEARRIEAFRQRINSIISPPNTQEGAEVIVTNEQKAESLRGLYEQMSTEPMTVQETATFINLLKGYGDYESVIKIFDSATDPAVHESEILQEFYAVSLNKTGKYAETIEFCKLLIENGVRNGEVYSAMGKAERELSKQASRAGSVELARSHLTSSYELYLQGYLTDFEFYPGINAVYNLQLLGRQQEAENLAGMVYASTEVAGGLESRDYWCLTTMLELACITKKPQAEVQTILSQVTKYARTSEEIEGSTLPMIRSLRDQRQEADGQIEQLDEVIRILEERAEQLKNGNKEVVNDEGINPSEIEILKYFYNYLGQTEGSVSHFIGGNIEWNGQLHSETINRSDMKKADALLTRLGLDDVTDIKYFNEVIDMVIRRQFGTSGLEDLHGPDHETYDTTVKGLLELMEGQTTGGHTNIMVDLELGLGDCRHHAYTKQLLFDTWKRNCVNRELTNAYVALTQNGDQATFDAILGQVIPELQRTQMYVFDMTVQAPIQTEGKYNPIEDEGRWIASPDGEQHQVEDHTATVIVTHDTPEGDMITFADSFYQERHYRWGYSQQSPETAVPLSFLSEQGYLPAGKISVKNPGNGETMEVEVRAYPATYAGARQRHVYDNYGGTLLRGVPVHSTSETLIRNLGLSDETPTGGIEALKAAALRHS